jgi:hypothetical protein
LGGRAPCRLSLLSARRRVPARTPPDEQDHHDRAGAHQQADHEHPEACPDRPVELDPGVGLDVDAAGGVGAHHDHGPAAELGIPGKRLFNGAFGLGYPEALFTGWRKGRSARIPLELGLVAVKVDQFVAYDVTEVAIDVTVAPDADEDGCFALNPDSNLAEDLVGGPVDLVDPEVDVLRGDRVGGARELPAIRAEVAVVAIEEVASTAMPPARSAKPISPPMLAKTIPIMRPAVQFDLGGAGPAVVFEVEACSPPSVTGQAYVARERDAKADGLRAM